MAVCCGISDISSPSPMKTAERLGMQPPLSQKIGTLAQEPDVQLFRRKPGLN
jgi:hypothetical protein